MRSAACFAVTLIAAGCGAPEDRSSSGAPAGVDPVADASSDADEATSYAMVEEGEWAPGGATTNRLLLGANAFTFPAQNLEGDRRSSFFAGDSFFNQSWVTAPASTETRDGLGPTFNAVSCSSCHAKDGRGRPPEEGSDAEPMGLLVRLSIPGRDAHGGPVPDPTYGGQLQPRAILGVAAEASVRITYEEVEGRYEDGEPYALRAPHYEFEELAFGPLHDEIRFSPRVAPIMVGLGLLESIPEERLEALADPDDDDGDGISGRVNRVWDVTRGATVAGRFGWKAEQPSLLQQAAGAFVGDIGITSRVFPEQNCPAPQTDCASAPSGGTPELEDHLLDATVYYSRTLAVPVRRDWDEPEVLSGKQLFYDSGCAGCHTPRHQTSSSGVEPELSDQTIWPYTDLLVHDMGDGLADGREIFDATGHEWRTPPLWGLGFIEAVNGHELLMHDGRARGVAEAILWHGGEAEASKEAFRSMPRADRDALVRFVRSL